MARGRSGVISKEYKGEDNTAYHDVIKLFKIYRVVNWQMQIKISQVKRRFHMEYGTDVDEFLDTIYQAGMDVERDLASEKERVEAISRSNQYLRLIDEAVDLMTTPAKAALSIQRSCCRPTRHPHSLTVQPCGTAWSFTRKPGTPSLRVRLTQRSP